jgi:DNA-binding MarR family transcriptional regulator
MATHSETNNKATAELASELRVVLGRLMRRLRAHHRHFGLTQAAVLGRLDRCGPQSIGELASAERVRPQSMSQTLGDLEADGFIERRADETDGRRTLIALTDEGRAALLEERALREGWLASSIETLTPADRALLVDAVSVLDRLSEL